MTPVRRLLVLLAVLLASIAGAVPAAWADDAPGGDDNAALAVNTEDGASVFRLAFSVRMVANGVIDESNRAYALASCTDCQTVALAFQVVLVWNDPNIVVPVNQAVAYNEKCVECLTFASATQIVLGFDGPVRFTGEGRRRLAEWERALADLEKQLATMSAGQLVSAVNAAKAELVAILSEELVPIAVPRPTAGTTTSTAPADLTTTAPATPTTTSDVSMTSSTTATTAASTTPTSTEPTTTVPTTTTTTAPTTTTVGG